MNRIYKLKFDKRRNELVIVSEITAGAGKEKSTGHIADLTALSPFRKLLETLTPVALLTGFIISQFPGMVLAADLPAGGQIVGGQGSISTSGNQMTIHQQTQNMATNWHSFDIGKNNTVQFVQPDSSSVALNRVTGASGSQIMGTLKANGQVFILNPNGVLFGKDARVNVAGLVASTKNISTADFMKGQYTLSGEGNSGAQVVNQGSLTTSKGGYIVLAGERVSNSGTISTPGGKSVLAAGKMVTLQLDNGGLTSVSVNGSVVNTLVENRGLISATDGKVYLTAKGQDMLLNTVVNNSGTIEAKGLASRGGEIVLDGGDNGVVSQSGYLLADSHTGQGGKITQEGQNIHLAANSLTSATGKTGGGEVYVGGGWQGKDGNIKNASKVVMDKAAIVDVSATENGNGGTAVLWSDGYTNFRGTVFAKGGAQSGNGGRVETSSHRNLQASGAVDASARAGHGGEWLLDPTDVTIVAAGSDSNIDSSTSSGIFTPTADVAQILNSSIEQQLNAGTNVTVKTSGTDTDGQTGNITVNANIVKTAGADAKLTLLADDNISTDDNISISATAWKLNLDLLAGNTTNNASISLGGNINISLNGGYFQAGAAGDTGSVSLGYKNNGQIYGGNVTLNVSGGLTGYAYRVKADNDLTINGPVTGSTGGAALSFIAGGMLTMNSPTFISLTATKSARRAGSVLISGDKGVSLNTVDGNILLNADSAVTNTVNVSSTNGTVSMSAGGNLTLGYATVISNAGQDVTLKAAGKDHSLVKITGSMIKTGGGNISIDRVAVNAMTIKIVGSTLNASTAATDAQSEDGSITLNAWNPNINLYASTYNKSVRNGGAMLEVSGNSQLTGRDLILHTTLEGGNAAGLPVFLNNATLRASRDILLSGTAIPFTTSSMADDGTVETKITNPNVASIELRGNGNVLMAGGNIAIENQAAGNSNGVYLNGSASGKAQLTAGGNITLNGSSAGSGSGVLVTNSILNASRAEITGCSSSGTGFSLTKSTLAGALTDLANVTFSSAGSGAGAVNVLDSSIVNNTSRDALLTKHIGSMTTVDMGGQAIFNDSTKGWVHDYSLPNLPNDGWIMNNTRVTAGGDVNLKGVGFTNSTVTVTNGNLSIDNRGPVPLSGTTLTVNDGAVNLHAGAGTLDLGKANISAKGDITLKADNGPVWISGTNATVKANISSTGGNVTVDGVGSAQSIAALSLRDVSISAKQGEITITGNSSFDSPQSTMSKTQIGAVVIDGCVSLESQRNILNAQNTWIPGNVALVKKMPATALLFGTDSRLFMTGTSFVNAHASAGAGIVFDSGFGAKSNTISIVNGDLHINASTGDAPLTSATAVGAITINNTYNDPSIPVYILLDNANVSIEADASGATHNPVYGFAASSPVATGSGRSNGFVFKGSGNVTVEGSAAKGDGVNARLLSNTGLSGSFSVQGKSDSGNGVSFDGGVNAELVGAEIKGESKSGAGIAIKAWHKAAKKADLSGSILNGISETGAGIQLTGNNITLTSGTLTGTATSGNGSGVVLTGGRNYILDGASITGTAVDGSGIAVNGTLTVNNGTAVEGHATGNGNGVTVSGDLATDSGGGISITGTALSGDGIKVDGDTTLASAVLNGSADSGTGVNIAGNLTTDSATQVSGHAASGTGVNLGAALTGATVEGNSDTGTGVQLADNAVVTEAVLNGTSASGDGVAVTGNVTLDDTSAAALNASSTSGSGLKLADNANVSIQTITQVTQEKKDADGNPVLDADGNPETETVTTQSPVTTPVTLTGTSDHGTGIATEGNVSISGIVLNGSTTADTGTGVSLGGNLTIADDISGVTAGATGSGTALVVNNASIHSDGYTDSGKDFVINASVSGNGTAIKTQGSSQLDEVVLNGDATGGGTAVELGGQVSGANITGTSDSGTAVRVTDGAGVDGSVVKGHSDSGTGLQVSGNASLSHSGLSGTTQTGTGAAVTGSLTADNSSQVTGSATQDGGAGVTLDGSVTGATVTGDATSGDAVRIADGSQLTGADIKGTSVTGTGIKTQGNVTLEGGTQLAGGSEQGAALDVSGTLNHDPDSSVTTTPDNTGSVIGNENIHEVIPVVPPVPEEGGNSQPDHLPDGGVDKPVVDNPSVPSEPV
ncbi:filamentous hemagglutinin N-terminal domain-containing protein, partial [Salmonella enterica subsp. enterica serovar Oslo]|nr:filamentous hemagglutinin N-terminal domain-containing protein [Salmonella enterica subsp. enterica serovar Oslo]